MNAPFSLQDESESLSSWEMSARSLFARQRVESLRWFQNGYTHTFHHTCALLCTFVHICAQDSAQDARQAESARRKVFRATQGVPGHRALGIAPGGEFSLEFSLRRFDRRSICGVTSCARLKRARYAQSPPEPEPAKTLLHLFSRPPRRETV